MKKVLGVVVLLAGIAGGFICGKMQNAQPKAAEAEPVEAAEKKANGEESLEQAQKRILELERELATLRRKYDEKKVNTEKKEDIETEEVVSSIETTRNDFTVPRSIPCIELPA